MLVAFSLPGCLPPTSSTILAGRLVTRRQRAPWVARRIRTCTLQASAGGEETNEMDEYYGAVEAVFVDALASYYEDAPLYTEAEFGSLRDEIEHLASAQMRLGRVEELWMRATSARDFDRRLRAELQMSEDEYAALKQRVVAKHRNLRPAALAPPRAMLPPKLCTTDTAEDCATDAERVEWKKIDSRLKWFLFGDATEEKLKVAMLYFPAVLMTMVAISILSLLFASLDGEMSIHVSHKGQMRLGLLTYVTIFFTAWFADKVTPMVLDFLDLGQPTLLRGACPNCTSAVSCLFTGAVRVRDERKCKVCGATVGFNRKWNKVYLVDTPRSIKRSRPD